MTDRKFDLDFDGLASGLSIDKYSKKLLCSLCEVKQIEKVPSLHLIEEAFVTYKQLNAEANCHSWHNQCHLLKIHVVKSSINAMA